MISTLKNDNTWKDFPTLNWWDGWWVTKPRNIMEQLIEIIWKRFPDIIKVAGFEYWSNLHVTNGNQDWHFDKDEKYYSETKKYTVPFLGHIYYVENLNVNGGYLEISNLPNSEKPDLTKIERIYPTENRLVIHNPTQIHRVTEVLSGKRRAFLANTWIKKPSTFDNAENVDGKNFEEVSWPNKFK